MKLFTILHKIRVKTLTGDIEKNLAFVDDTFFYWRQGLVGIGSMGLVETINFIEGLSNPSIF